MKIKTEKDNFEIRSNLNYSIKNIILIQITNVLTPHSTTKCQKKHLLFSVFCEDNLNN